MTSITIWTDERIAVAKRMWQEGASAGEIACELNCGFSRNAVIGKLHRLGVTQGGDRADKRREATRAATRARLRYRAARAPRPSPPRPSPLPDVPPIAASPSLQAPRPIEPEMPAEPPRLAPGCTLAQLTSNTCRWPIGNPSEPDFYFCGEPPKQGTPYCPCHHLVACRPNQQPINTRFLLRRAA